jgi:mono/diheme cytochrome c family protein
MNIAALKWLMVLSTILVLQGPVWAQDRDFGKMEYHFRCAVCHGNDGKGHGPLADQLKAAPADLTQLAKTNGGVFPRNAVHEIIDGRQEVKAHGPRDMPVWGYRYMPSHPEAVVRSRIRALVDYLYRIQEK